MPEGRQAAERRPRLEARPRRWVLVVALMGAVLAVGLWIGAELRRAKPVRLQPGLARGTSVSMPSAAPPSGACPSGGVPITTVCGEALRCKQRGTEQLVALAGPREPPHGDRCWSALSLVRPKLLHILEAPLARGFRKADPFEQAKVSSCAQPSLQQQQRAYRTVLDQVVREGIERTKRMSERREYWAQLMQDRFDFLDMQFSCALTDPWAYLMKVRADVGAPGVIPYVGIWLIDGAGKAHMRFEAHDDPHAAYWGVGDLDGNQVNELVARTTKERRPKVLRYELVDVANRNRLELLDYQLSGDDDEGPALLGVALKNGAVLVVGDQLHRYQNQQLTAAPAGAREEVAAARTRARGEVRRALTMLEQTLPTPPRRKPCERWARIGWAHRLSRLLVRVGPWDQRDATAHCAAMAGVDACM